MTKENQDTSRQKLGEQPYTKEIQAFFTDMADWPWRAQLPNALFIRDYHHLPKKSPYDIDLMIDVAEQSVFLKKTEEQAKVFNLHCFTRRSASGCFVLLFDLDVSRAGRAWAFLEVHDSLVISPAVLLSARDIEIVTDERTGLPVPTKPWVAFLEVFQGIRANKLGKAEEVLRSLNIPADGFTDIFTSLTGERVQLPSLLTDKSDDIAKLKRLIVLKKEKPIPTGVLPLKTRLNRVVFKNAYYIHYAKPWLFTIHGPDGVGKSTTCTEVEKIFARLPLPLCSHHHITGWKRTKHRPQVSESTGTGNSIEQKIDKSVEVVQTGYFHAFLRWGYHKMPHGLQNGYVLAQGYHHYLKNLNWLVFKEYTRGNIIFIDRYIYDLVTKNIINGTGWATINKIFVKLARLPLRTYVLTDTPENIHSRKQELTIDEIGRYEVAMASVMQGRGASIKTIDLDGKSPETVAQIISRDILSACSPGLFEIFRAIVEKDK